MNIIVYLTRDSTGGRSSRLSKKQMKGGSKFQVIYFEVGQWDGLHEVKAECNSKKVLQDPDPAARGRGGRGNVCISSRDLKLDFLLQDTNGGRAGFQSDPLCSSYSCFFVCDSAELTDLIGSQS